MPYKNFVMPVFYGEWAERELNQFLRSHRVLSVDRRFADQGANSYWAILVDYLEKSPDESWAPATAPDAKKRVDYKELLSPEDFEVFVRLRVVRKEIAEQDGVAVYNVFTNEQLAQIARSRPRTVEDLRQIPGIGEARVEKYGARILEVLNQIREEPDEKSEESAGTNP